MEEPRICDICGRTIAWRRSLARDWTQVRRCSQRCRRARLSAHDRALEAALRAQLLAHGSADPAQVAGADPAQREPARCAARRIVASGDAKAIQGGRVVDASTARGPFTLRR